MPRAVPGILNPARGVRLKARYVNPLSEEAGRYVSRFHVKNPTETVEYVYSRGSRRMKGTPNILAVRLAGGKKGWITESGTFQPESDIYQLMLSLDGTVAAAEYSLSFTGLWNKMSAKQRAEFADAIQDIDLEDLWEDKYNPEDPYGDPWMDVLIQIISALDSVINPEE